MSRRLWIDCTKTRRHWFAQFLFGVCSNYCCRFVYCWHLWISVVNIVKLFHLLILIFWDGGCFYVSYRDLVNYWLLICWFDSVFLVCHLISLFVFVCRWRPILSIGLAVLCFCSKTGFWPSYCQLSTDLDKILHTPIVVRNTLVGRLRPWSARGRRQAKPKRLWFCNTCNTH